MVLSAEQLQHILVGKTEIDFENIFVKSRAVRTFHIRNDLRTSISVQLEVENMELQESYLKPQIIHPSSSAGFDLVFRSPDVKEFKGTVKYIINNHHEFLFTVKAKVEPVRLELSKNSIKLTFSEDNFDMFTTQTFRVINRGNAPANFDWQLGEQKLFQITPTNAQVQPGDSILCTIQYNPTGNNAGKPEEEKILLKIQDGIDQIIRCTGMVNESKCIIVNKNLDLGQVAIGKKVEGRISIKNLYKFPTVFYCGEGIPAFTEISPMKGKIAADSTAFLKVSFFCKEETQISSEIVVQFRGGKSQKIPFLVESIIPKVFVQEPVFDFGDVTNQTHSDKINFTIINQSKIPASLVMDLRPNADDERLDGIECLQLIKPVIDDSVMQSICSENLDDIDSQSVDDISSQKEESVQINNQSGEVSEQENDDNQKKAKRLWKIQVNPGVQISLQLQFCPTHVKKYEFELPLQLIGCHRLDQLSRKVLCTSLEPKLLFDKTKIVFKRKVIASLDKVVPSTFDITVSNPCKTSVQWRCGRMDDEYPQIFDIQPNKGRLDGEQMIVLKVLFKPQTAGSFSKTVSLFINDSTTKYIDFNLSGESYFPKIMFDRRELIFPIVPLGITSQIEFTITNDGYENLALRHNIIQDLAPLNIQLKYLDGKQLGVTKNKIKIEATFQNQKPLSFTTNIEFYDENAQVYILPVSGTTDSSLLTVTSYLQRKEGDYFIIADEKKPLIIKEEEYDSIEIPKSQNQSMKSVGTGSVKSSAQTLLGFSPVPLNLLDQSRNFIMRWLNCNVLSSSIENFPQDIIQSNGDQLFELITYSFGKPQGNKAKLDLNAKRQANIPLLIQQYEEVIKILKENGCLLNTIRPQYLLSYQDFQIFQTLSSNDQITTTQKVSEQKFNYVSYDSWIQLFNQVIKIFHVSKVNKKSFKLIPNMPDNKYKEFNTFYNEGSNYISSYEGILLRWLEVNQEIQNPSSEPQRLTNFGNDLRDCLYFANTLRNYLSGNSIKHLNMMKVKCVNQEDYEFNAQKFQQVLDEVGIISHCNFNSFINPLQNDLILFTQCLFQQLPHYVPKQSAVLFQCILGQEIIKHIELSNPTTRQISYYVRYEGSNDFSTKDAGNIECDSITIEPKNNAKFYVKFSSRVSQSVEGKIYFTNKKEGNQQAAALVFNLRSDITSRQSIEKWETNSKLYQPQEKKIEVKNIFINSNFEYAEFQIRIEHQKLDFQDKPVKQIKKDKKNNKNGLQDQVQPIVDDEQIIAPFFCLKEKIRIKRGETSYLNIEFMPFTLEVHKAHILFINENVGEFQHEIIGKTLLPEITSEIKPVTTIYVDSKTPLDINFNFKNDMILQAKKIHDNRLIASGKHKERENYLRIQQRAPNIESMNYQVTMIPPCQFIQYPQQIESFDSLKLAKNSTENTQSGDSNKLQLSLDFKNPVKDFQCQFQLMNAQKSDVRLFNLQFSVIPKPVKAILDFKAPVLDEIRQEIPITNNSDKDWVIKIAWTVPEQFKNMNYFSGPKDFLVKRKTTNSYVIVYRPLSQLPTESKLIMTNPITSDVFEYLLKGLADEPLARDHIVIHCQAQKPVKRDILIQNPYSDKEVQYVVETDLMNPEGLEKFKIKPNQQFNYPLTIKPQVGGVYTGSITFFEHDSREKYIWYTVQVITERPAKKNQIKLSAHIRNAAAFEIQLTNPTNTLQVYDVQIDGEGLEGEREIVLQSHEDKKYELIFSPLRVFQGKGSISIMNEQLGEIWYELDLLSEPAPVIKLKNFISEIGKKDTQEIQLENPTMDEAKVTVTSTSDMFTFKPESFLDCYLQTLEHKLS